MFICNICNYEFKKKQSLQIHLNEKRCKSPLLNDLSLLHQYIGKLKNLPVNISCISTTDVSKNKIFNNDFQTIQT